MKIELTANDDASTIVSVLAGAACVLALIAAVWSHCYYIDLAHIQAGHIEVQGTGTRDRFWSTK